MERINPDLTAHSLAICGLTSYRATILELVGKINELQEHIEDLESLVSGEIMAGLARPAELREVVKELGAGWRIERQPALPNASDAMSDPPAGLDATQTTTAEDVDRQMAGVSRVLGAYRKYFGGGSE